MLDGDPAPSPQKGATAPNFRPMSVVAKRLHGWTNMPLGMEVGYDTRPIVLDGDPASHMERSTSAPYFSSHV